jgi:hypothetical protein
MNAHANKIHPVLKTIKERKNKNEKLVEGIF